MANPTISESGNNFWVNNAFLPAVAGVSSASVVGSAVQAVVGSGQYVFTVNGVQGAMVCGAAAESFNVTITCPTGQTVSKSLSSGASLI